MSGFQANHARDHTAIHLAADTGNGAATYGGVIGDQDVAGGGADDLDQGVEPRTGPDRAHVAVEGTAGNHDVFRQMQAGGPFGGDVSNRNVGGPGFGEQRVIEIPGQTGIQRIQEFRRWQAAPFRMPQRLVAGGAAASSDAIRRLGSAQQGRYPVTEFNPIAGALAHRRIGPGQVQYLVV